MTFSKTFPREVKGSNYPVWEEITLTKEEESVEDAKAREENIKLMKECLKDSEKIIKDERLKDFQTNAVSIAISLFEKRASHSVYWKEWKCKEKFDKIFGNKNKE